MAKNVSWAQRGSEHVALCRELAKTSSNLDEAVAEAVDALPAKRLPHMTQDERDALLNAGVLAFESGESFSFTASYIFWCSIFVAAARADPHGN